jgi:hypothetical protein
MERRKTNWIAHIFRMNGLLKDVMEGKIEGRIEVTGRRRRGEHLPGNFMKRRRQRTLKEEALDGALWRTCFGRGYGSVVRQTKK